MARNRSHRQAGGGGRAQIALGKPTPGSAGRPPSSPDVLHVWVDPILDPVVSDEGVRLLVQLLGDDLIRLLADVDPA